MNSCEPAQQIKPVPKTASSNYLKVPEVNATIRSTSNNHMSTSAQEDGFSEDKISKGVEYNIAFNQGIFCAPAQGDATESPLVNSK